MDTFGVPSNLPLEAGVLIPRLLDVLAHKDARGRGYGGICVGIADSLCYTAETNTPL